MSRTYRELLDQAVIDFSLYTGDIQNRGTAAMTMITIGTPRFSRIPGRQSVGLEQVALTDGIRSSAVIAPIVDVTGTITIEYAGYFKSPGVDQLFFQSAATGGFNMNCPVANRIDLVFYSAAGGYTVAREIRGPAILTPANNYHLVVTSTTGGTAGQWYAFGAPAATTLIGAGVTASSGNALLYAGGNYQGLWYSEVVRAWQGALDASEVALLYNAYSTLTVPSKL